MLPKNNSKNIIVNALAQAARAISAFVFVAVLSSGAVQAREGVSSTGQVVKASAIRSVLPTAILGDDSYEVVNSASLKSMQAEFARRLTQMGLQPKWDRRFDCNKLTETFVVVAQVGHATRNWNSSNAANSLAVGEFWFMRDDATAHAIVFAVTERGLIFWDPQTASEVQLTPKQRQRVLMAKL